MSRITKIGLILSLALAMGGGFAQAQDAGMDKPGMRPDRQQMHQQMMEEMKAQDDRLDALVQKMNAATGQAKVDAIAAVVTELVEQRHAMRAHMSERRMRHGGGKGGKQKGAGAATPSS